MIQALTANRSPYPPGPRRPAWMQTVSWIRRPAEVLDRCARRYGTPFTLRMYRKPPTVVVSDPETVRWVFGDGASFFETGPTNAGFRDFGGPCSLLTLDGEPHRRHRRSLSPPFHGDHLKDYAAAAEAVTAEEVKSWPVGRFRIQEPMHRITHRVILRAIFGARKEPTSSWLVDVTARIANGVSPLTAHFAWTRVDLGRWSSWGRFVAARAELDRFIYSEIERARAGADAVPSILAGLARAGALTEREIRDEVLTFLAVGHETTAAALTWAWQWVLSWSRRKEIVDQVRSGENELLEAAILESLRITPPVLLMQRALVRPASVCGYSLPEGTLVRPSPHLTHQDGTLFPDPGEYRPERFLGTRPESHAYYPFGGGPRSCLGTAMAVQQMKAVMAAVLSRADMNPACAPTRAARRRAALLVPAHGTPVERVAT